MEVMGRVWHGGKAAGSVVLATALLVGLGFFGQTPAHADNQAQMSLSASGAGVSCSAGVCDVELGGDFTLTVNVDDAPDSGYVLVQSFIDFGSSLTYNMTDSPADETTWPDASPDVIVRGDRGAGTTLIGALTAVIPPLPVSTFEGAVFELSFTCTDEYSASDVLLLPSGDPTAGTSGAVFSLESGGQVIPKVSSLSVNCGEAPEPTATPPAAPTPETPTNLPGTGNGGFGANEGGTNLALWLMIGALVVAGTAGLGMAGWRAARRTETP